jgi:hypothetical protein
MRSGVETTCGSPRRLSRFLGHPGGNDRGNGLRAPHRGVVVGVWSLELSLGLPVGNLAFGAVADRRDTPAAPTYMAAGVVGGARGGRGSAQIRPPGGRR